MISAISESMQQVMVYLMVLMQMVKGKGSLALKLFSDYMGLAISEN